MKDIHSNFTEHQLTSITYGTKWSHVITSSFDPDSFIVRPVNISNQFGWNIIVKDMPAENESLIALLGGIDYWKINVDYNKSYTINFPWDFIIYGKYTIIS